MNVVELATEVNKRLRKCAINPRHTLSQFKVPNEDYRQSPEYTDPVHYPTYYHLGNLLKPGRLLDVGLESGLESGAFIQGSGPVQTYFAFRESNPDYYWSHRLPCCNVVNQLRAKFHFWHGQMEDPEFLKQFLRYKWDCILIPHPRSAATARRYMDLMWEQLPLEGAMVIDHLRGEVEPAYLEFCAVKNREPAVIRSRYGMGLIVK